MILHLLAQSPFQGPALEHCQSACADQDWLLLLEDGVYALSTDRALPGARIFALEADLKARGLEAPAGVEVVDYRGFVRLTTQVEKTLSWY